MRRVYLVAALLCGACQIVPGTTAYLEQRARERLSVTLFDAESARFRNLRTVRDGSGQAICGEVNAKNRLGAYAGFRRFIVSRHTDFTVVEHGAGLAEEPETKQEIDDTAHQAGFDAAWENC